MVLVIYLMCWQSNNLRSNFSFLFLLSILISQYIIGFPLSILPLTPKDRNCVYRRIIDTNIVFSTLFPCISFCLVCERIADNSIHFECLYCITDIWSDKLIKTWIFRIKYDVVFVWQPFRISFALSKFRQLKIVMKNYWLCSICAVAQTNYYHRLTILAN